jgi:hypothetical protein
MFDVQFDISGELAGVTVRAQVVGSRDFHLTNCRQYEFGAEFPVIGLKAALARKGALLGCGFCEAQEFAQGCRAGLVQGRAHGHLDGLQIQSPRLAAAVEDNAQQLVYFARDFVTDGLRRFFSSGESVSGSDGRIRQICALTWISSLCRP